jgi:hypothetical protein
MEFLHCPACRYAFDVCRYPACPRCGARRGETSPDVVGEVTRIGGMLGRAGDTELDAIAARLRDHATDDPWTALIANAIAGAIEQRDVEPTIATVPKHDEPNDVRALLLVAIALLARIADTTRRRAWSLVDRWR